MTKFFFTPFLQIPSILECNRIIDNVYPYSLNFATLFASHLNSILTLFFLKSLVKLLLHDERSLILNKFYFFISFFIAINVHMARNPLQINLYLVILLPQFFYSRSCLISIVLASSNFSTFQSFQSSLTVRLGNIQQLRRDCLLNPLPQFSVYTSTSPGNHSFLAQVFPVYSISIYHK